MSTPAPRTAEPTTGRSAPTMTLWRLEVARLVRTKRWMIVVGVFAFFGVVGPITARYINEIIARVGGGVEIVAPDARPVDGILQFVGNTTQLGVLAVVVVAASALALDTKPELAAFLRTKVARPATLVIPPYAMSVAVSVIALVIGTGLAWALTAALIGALPAGAMVVGTLYGALYLAFAVAVVALVVGYVRSQATAVFAALGVLLLFPIVGVIDPVKPWLPSQLLTAIAALIEGAGPGEFLRSAIVTVLATAGLLALAARRMQNREL